MSEEKTELSALKAENEKLKKEIEELLKKDKFSEIFSKILLWGEKTKNKEELYQENQCCISSIINSIFNKIFPSYTRLIDYIRMPEYRDALFQLIRISQKIDEAKNE